MSERSMTARIGNIVRSPRELMAAGLAVAALALSACGSGEGNPDAERASVGDIACDVEGFKDFASNSKNYADQAAFPKAANGIDDKAEAGKYVEDLFKGEDGPFGEKTDPRSLAAMVSLVTEQARDKEAADPRYDYSGVFQSNLQAYKAEGGKKRAGDDCEDTVNVLKQVASYEEGWAKGKPVTKLVAVRDGNNKIVDFRPSTRVVFEDGLEGVVLQRPKTESDVSGFNDAIITAKGEAYLDGVTVTRSKGGSKDKDQRRKGNQIRKNADGGAGGGASTAGDSPESQDGPLHQKNDNTGPAHDGKHGVRRGRKPTPSGGSARPGDSPESGPGPVGTSEGPGRRPAPAQQPAPPAEQPAPAQQPAPPAEQPAPAPTPTTPSQTPTTPPPTTTTPKGPDTGCPVGAPCE